MLLGCHTVIIVIVLYTMEEGLYMYIVCMIVHVHVQTDTDSVVYV